MSTSMRARTNAVSTHYVRLKPTASRGCRTPISPHCTAYSDNDLPVTTFNPVQSWTGFSFPLFALFALLPCLPCLIGSPGNRNQGKSALSFNMLKKLHLQCNQNQKRAGNFSGIMICNIDIQINIIKNFSLYFLFCIKINNKTL